MDNRSLLNSIYEPLDRTGRTVLKEVRELGYTAALNYYNLHEVKVDGAYQTEYFPLPEIEIRDQRLNADFGISLDMTGWLELTVSREKALDIDYEMLGRDWEIEVYGAENYLADYCRGRDGADEVKALIAASDEQQIHINVTVRSLDAESIRQLFALLRDLGI